MSCQEVEDMASLQDIWTNLLFLFPIILCLFQKRWWVAFVLITVMVLSIVHHVYEDSDLIYRFDQAAAYTAAITVIYLALTYKSIDAYKISFILLGLSGYIIYLVGKCNKTFHTTSHNLFHVFSAMATFILLLPGKQE